MSFYEYERYAQKRIAYHEIMAESYDKQLQGASISDNGTKKAKDKKPTTNDNSTR